MVGRNATRSGSVTHDGCLLVDVSGSWSNSPTPPRVGNPALTANLTPSANSPALDICLTASSPSKDFYGHARSVDQYSTPNVHGALDLGAVERALGDTIFADGLE